VLHSGQPDGGPPWVCWRLALISRLDNPASPSYQPATCRREIVFTCSSSSAEYCDQDF
jgi:hypothetical protein